MLQNEFFKCREFVGGNIPSRAESGIVCQQIYRFYIHGDYIFSNNERILKLSRSKKTKLYASGIQIINPKKINQMTNNCSSFRKLWEQLIKKKSLYVSNTYPGKWFAIDNIKNLKDIKKSKNLKKYFFK